MDKRGRGFGGTVDGYREEGFECLINDRDEKKGKGGGKEIGFHLCFFFLGWVFFCGGRGDTQPFSQPARRKLEFVVRREKDFSLSLSLSLSLFPPPSRCAVV